MTKHQLTVKEFNDIQDLLTKLTEDLHKASATIITLQETMTTLTPPSLIPVIVDSSLFQSTISTLVTEKFNTFKSEITHNNQEQRKNYTDCIDELKILQATTHPNLSSVLNSLSIELMSSREVTKNALESLLRLTELSVNKISTVTDASFSSFFDTWIAFLRYRENRGTLKFSVLLRQSPSVMSIYLIRARTRNQIFSFNFNLHDEECFTEILTTVFYPDGITVDAYRQLIHAKRMLGPFSIQKAAVLSIHVFSVIQALHGHLPEHHISACWTQTAHAVQDAAFRYSLLTQHPRTFENFWSTIDNRARIFSDQHSPSSPSLSTSDTSQYSPSQQHQSPPANRPSSHHSPPSRQNTLNSEQRARVNEVRLTPVASDQVCTNCHRIGLHRPEFCPVIDHMLSLRLDHATHPDTIITEDDFKDLDFSFE
jgi:hypothetical protein